MKQAQIDAAASIQFPKALGSSRDLRWPWFGNGSFVAWSYQGEAHTPPQRLMWALRPDLVQDCRGERRLVLREEPPVVRLDSRRRVLDGVAGLLV